MVNWTASSWVLCKVSERKDNKVQIARSKYYIYIYYLLLLYNYELTVRPEGGFSWPQVTSAILEEKSSRVNLINREERYRADGALQSRRSATKQTSSSYSLDFRSRRNEACSLKSVF